MRSRPTALLLAALLLVGVTACGRGTSVDEPALAAPTGQLQTRAAGPSIEHLSEPGPASTVDVDDVLRTHEELSEDDPSSDEAPSTSEEATDATSSSTSTTRPRRVPISNKAEPTGPGVPPIPPYTQSPEEIEYFNCVTMRESSNNPRVINLSSGAAGLFQFLQSTWDMVARRLGRFDLVGVNPALASVETQRWFAHVLFLWQGSAPWVSDGCVVPSAPTTTTASTSPASTSSTSTTSTTTEPSSTEPRATS